MATVGEDGKGVIFTIKGGDGEFIQGPQSKELIGHKDAINDVSFSSNSQYIMTCSSDGYVKLWDTESGKCKHTITTDQNKLINAKFSPDFQKCICLSRQVVSVWNLATGKLEWESTDIDGRGYQVSSFILNIIFSCTK